MSRQHVYVGVFRRFAIAFSWRNLGGKGYFKHAVASYVMRQLRWVQFGHDSWWQIRTSTIPTIMLSVLVSCGVLRASARYSACSARRFGVAGEHLPDHLEQHPECRKSPIRYYSFSRGGTTGYYNQSDPNNNSGLNTLSQRYDDPYYVQNINRSTTAGMFAGRTISRVRISSGRHRIPEASPTQVRTRRTTLSKWPARGCGPVSSSRAVTSRTATGCGRITRWRNSASISPAGCTRMGIRPAIYLNGNYAANILGGRLQCRCEISSHSRPAPYRVLCRPLIQRCGAPVGQTRPIQIRLTCRTPSQRIPIPRFMVHGTTTA